MPDGWRDLHHRRTYEKYLQRCIHCLCLGKAPFYCSESGPLPSLSESAHVIPLIRREGDGRVALDRRLRPYITMERPHRNSKPCLGIEDSREHSPVLGK